MIVAAGVGLVFCLVVGLTGAVISQCGGKRVDAKRKAWEEQQLARQW